MNKPFGGRSFSNSGKRLLITFCLDVSPSMGSEILGKKSAITILNETVSGIVEELSKDKKLKSMVELMFVTFCTDVLHVERMPLNKFAHRAFTEEPVGGSDIPNAVLSTFGLIDERIGDYQKAGIRYHSPIFQHLGHDADWLGYQLRRKKIGSPKEIFLAVCKSDGELVLYAYQ